MQVHTLWKKNSEGKKSAEKTLVGVHDIPIILFASHFRFIYSLEHSFRSPFTRQNETVIAEIVARVYVPVKTIIRNISTLYTVTQEEGRGRFLGSIDTQVETQKFRKFVEWVEAIYWLGHFEGSALAYTPFSETHGKLKGAGKIWTRNLNGREKKLSSPEFFSRPFRLFPSLGSPTILTTHAKDLPANMGQNWHSFFFRLFYRNNKELQASCLTIISVFILTTI